MAPEYRFYGLQALGRDGKGNHLASVEDMASHYLSEIRSLQPQWLRGDRAQRSKENGH